MIWEGVPIGDCFRAASDKQTVRDRVFRAIAEHDFAVQATVMQKSKAQPQVRASEATFYKYGWYYHFKNALAPHIQANDELLITVEAIGKRRVKAHFKAAVNEVLQQLLSRRKWATNFCASTADPCLQVADYCSWAIHRKWERNDSRSYSLIADRITYEYDLWAHGRTHYY
jgi:hypothetical protein